MMKEAYINPIPVPEEILREESFGDMIADGVVGKRCLTVKRLFGRTAQSFLSEAFGLCPKEDARLGFSAQSPRYANVYDHVRETEARLWGFLKDGKRVESLLLWDKDEALASLLTELNRGFMQKKTVTGSEAVIISSCMSVSEKDYDKLWKFLKQGGTIMFLDCIPKDKRLLSVLFSKKQEEKALLSDTYLKKETFDGGSLYVLKTQKHTRHVLKAALDDALKGNVWIEDTEPVSCRVRYLHKKANGKNIYLFYNDDEERLASQYVRLPYSTRIVAVHPQSGGTWLPEQQRYESETWFKLWLQPEECLLYIEEGDEYPLLHAEDYPKKASWENLSGEARISGYGAMPRFFFSQGEKAVLINSRTWENYQMAVTVSKGSGKLCFGFGEGVLTISEKEFCYALGEQKLCVPFSFETPAKRLYISIEQKDFSVSADGEMWIKGKASEGREFSVFSHGDFSVNSLYAIKIK